MMEVVKGGLIRASAALEGTESPGRGAEGPPDVSMFALSKPE